jgi:homoserine dehydrogenase
MLTYRAEPGLEASQGRRLPGEPGFELPFRVQGWLEHQGQKLRRRFDARSYLLQAEAMDHHDLDAAPPGVAAGAIRASSLVVDVDTDQLFTPAQVEALAARLGAGGAHVERATLRSAHGHDAFLIEWDALAPLVARALALPPGEAGAATGEVATRVVKLASEEISLLLLGRGTVGGRLLAQLAANGPSLRDRHAVDLRLVGVVDRHRRLWEPRGLTPGDLPPRVSGPVEGPLPDVLPLLDTLARLPVPVLVDCTAAEGMEGLYREAFRRGIHVVAANKKPLALPFAERERLVQDARAHRRAYLYETTVGASLPVIETLKNLVRTGDRVERIDGSLSGTLGFLSHAVTGGEPLSRAVRTARDRGYTEPHPRDDLSGLDVARKALILARELGLRAELEDVAVEPFLPRAVLAEDDPEAFLRSLSALDDSFAEGIARYRAAGKVLRYLVQIVPGAPAGRQVRVGPVAVDADHPATGLRGAEALVAFTTERYHDYPLIVRGAGAGGDVTAAGVLADVLRLAQDIRGAPVTPIAAASAPLSARSSPDRGRQLRSPGRRAR